VEDLATERIAELANTANARRGALTPAMRAHYAAAVSAMRLERPTLLIGDGSWRMVCQWCRRQGGDNS